ncbi:4Fe-4S binding protein [Synergistaceae bacterium OttesenSCG-928-D05]|nr:4Fe-4S binding protein [Synergistaceae bacterium OttesenSCG-928-D05]
MPKGRVEIAEEFCKSCLLCVDVCPKKVLAISDKINAKGYRVVHQATDDCIGCGMCAVRCPDAVLEVYRED